ncbi:MAG: type II secretion system protein [Proteobacteria bacterium]|nr:type II secretion system protein [Pseudomonadota bacterium]
MITKNKKIHVLIACLICLILLTACSARKFIKKGDMYAAQNHWDEALDNYSEAMEKDPYSKEVRLKVARAKFEAAAFHLKKGEKLLAEGDYERAMLEGQIATALAPSIKRAYFLTTEAKKRKDAIFYYSTGLDFVRKGKNDKARAAFKKALSLNPALDDAAAELNKLQADKKTVMGGYELNLRSKRPITLKFKSAPITNAFDIISKLSGINFIFDEGVKKKKTSLYLENATFQQALELLLMTNKLFHKVVNENTIIIIPETKAKRQQYQDLLIHTFYLSNIEAKKAVNLLRTLLKVKSIYVNEALNTIVVRDTPEVVALAEKILMANDMADAEVMLDVEILEVSRGNSENLGLDIGVDAKITGKLVDLSQNPTSNLTYGTLKRFSRSDMLFTIPDIAINLKKSQGKVNLLANPKIRVLNKKKAKIHIGDRIPIVTVTTNNGVTSDNIQYVDVGVKLNVEPTIHINKEISLKLTLEKSSLGEPERTGSGGTVYPIGTRIIETELRINDGETQIIGGLIQDEERGSTIKIPFFGDIPILGRLFSSESNTGGKTDILLSITPHIVRLKGIADPEFSSIWSGRGQEFSSQTPFESFSEEDSKVTLPRPEDMGVPDLDTMPAAPGGPEAGLLNQNSRAFVKEPAKNSLASTADTKGATISW